MRLEGRSAVEGTNPRVYIGRRVYRAADGSLRSSNKYTAEYTIGGKQKQIALHTNNRQDAIRRVWELLPGLRANSVARSRITMAEVFEGWLSASRNRGLVKKSLRKYEYAWERLRGWLGNNGHVQVQAFNEPTYHEYRRYIEEDLDLSPKSVYTELNLIKSGLKWGHRAGLIEINPVALIPLRKPELTPQPVFTPDQLETLLAHADPVRRGLFAVMGLAGLRVGEAVALKWSAVTWGGGKGPDYIIVREGGSEGTTKNKRTRQVPICPELKRFLIAAPGPRDPAALVFRARPSKRHPNGDGPIDPRRLLVSLKRLCKRCGFRHPDQYKNHSLRHTFISMCAAQGVPEAYVLDWVGHRSSEVVKMYFHQFDHVAADQISKINFDGFRRDAS